MQFAKLMTGGLVRLLLASALLVPTVCAGHIVSFREVGNDVIASGSGPLDLTGLSRTVSTASVGHIDPDGATVVTGPAIPNVATVDALAGAGAWYLRFGSGSGAIADSGTGDMVGLTEGKGTSLLLVPAGYVSGNSLSNESTYANKSLGSLGLTPGTYVWSWGAGQNQNFTMVIGVAAGPLPIPEPSSAMLLGTTLAGMIVILQRRRQSRSHSTASSTTVPSLGLRCGRNAHLRWVIDRPGSLKPSIERGVAVVARIDFPPVIKGRQSGTICSSSRAPLAILVGKCLRLPLPVPSLC